MAKKLGFEFFSRDANVVARDLLGKVLVRRVDGGIKRFRVVETEAYFGEDDPASWARFGKRKDNLGMWGKPGDILVKNVHSYLMLNFVTGVEGEASAVLIRALEPLGFEAKCSGPGLLSLVLGIDKSFNGKNVFSLKEFWVEDSDLDFEVGRGFRVGVSEDLDERHRHFIKGNKCVRGNGKID